MIKTFYCTISILISLPLFFPTLLLAKNFPLYDATVDQLPSEQPWLTYFADGTFNPQVVTDGVRLQTNLGNRAGFSNYNVLTQSLKNPLFPSLDKDQGVVLDGDLALFVKSRQSESQVDRAGFVSCKAHH